MQRFGGFFFLLDPISKQNWQSYRLVSFSNETWHGFKVEK
jgi:hypothetical protein